MHKTLLEDIRTVVTRDGRAFLGGVEIKNPDECLSCGHVVTIAERFSTVEQLLDTNRM